MADLNKLMEITTQVQEVLNLESSNYQPLEGPKLAQVLESYGIDAFDGDIYYNAYNLIFTRRSDHEKLQYLIRGQEVVLRLEVSEFDDCLILVRYFNDYALSSLLEDT